MKQDALPRIQQYEDIVRSITDLAQGSFKKPERIKGRSKRNHAQMEIAKYNQYDGSRNIPANLQMSKQMDTALWHYERIISLLNKIIANLQPPFPSF